MKNYTFKKRFVFILSLFVLIGCADERYELGALVTPTNLNLTYEIQGANTNNPYGDGTGIVTFSVTADNAISYKFIHSGGEIIAPSGKATINFSKTGTFIYNVTAVAIGTGGLTSNVSVDAEVLVLYEPPAALLNLLVGNGSRDLRIKSESGGHFGVGPAGENAPIWYQAGANEKSTTGMYDDIYRFNADGTFTHLTKGTIFGQSGPIDQELGAQALELNGNNEYENYALDAYNGNWTLSAPGGVETLSLSGTGFIGYYVGGSHKYTIISRNDTEMVLKTIGLDGNAWFFTLVIN